MAVTKDSSGSWFWSGDNMFARAKTHNGMSVGFNMSMLGEKTATALLSSVTGVPKKNHAHVDMNRVVSRVRSNQEASPRLHFPKRSQSRNLPA